MRIFKNKMFYKWTASQGISDLMLAKAAGEIVQGLVDGHLGGSLVKKRVPRKGQGKRGGFRTIVVFQKGYRTFFVYGFPKNERANINQQEEKALKKLAENLLDAPDSRLREMISNGDLYEVMT